MKYYEHELYLRRKIVRKQIDSFFNINEEDDMFFKRLFNALALTVLSRCVENKDLCISGRTVWLCENMGIKENKIEVESFYLMTKSQIKKQLKNFDYEKSKSSICRWGYKWHYYYGVFILSEKKE